MDEVFATEVKTRALNAIRELNSIAAIPIDWKSEKMYKLRKAIGFAIGSIDYEILALVYQKFPELNDLKELDLTKYDDLLKP